MQQTQLPSVDNGVQLQIYLPSWGGELPGIREQLGYLRELGVSGVVTQPVGEYGVRDQDGPYSPIMDPSGGLRVAAEFGGDVALRALNQALRTAGITPVGDLVLNHISDKSPIWESAKAGDPKARELFRLIGRDPDAAGFGQKVNIFGEKSYIWVPELQEYRSATFYEDQIELDVTNATVQRILADTIRAMIDDLGYAGVRYDAIAYAGGRTLQTPTGEHEPAALALASYLRREVFVSRPTAKALAEAGGERAQIAEWLRHGRCQRAYDFGYGPAAIASLGRRDWGPLIRYLQASPLIDADAAWVLFLRSHDEWQLRYSQYREELVERHGGRDGEFVVFDGNGINQRLSALVAQIVEGERARIDAHVMMLGLTICLDGIPLLFQGDAERRLGNVHASERWPARDPMSWEPQGPLFGWKRKPAQPFAPDAASAAVSVQFADLGSPLNRVRRWIWLRNGLPALQHGERLDLISDNGAVLAFARTTPDQGDAIVLANASPERETAHLDLTRWRGKRLARLVTDPRAYATGSPDPSWTAAQWVGWDDARQYQVTMEPYELRVLLPY